MSSILFRFDASSKMGLGHAYRCMALIEQLSLIENISCLVLTQTLPDFIVRRLNDLKAPVYTFENDSEIKQINEISKQSRSKAIMLDGYQFTADYRASLSQLSLKVFCFDDSNDFPLLYCDLVINALPLAFELGYEKSAQQAVQLLGLDYSVIRKEFLLQKTTDYTQREKLLINFGGSDIADLTLPLIKKLIKTKIVSSPNDIIVITGGAYQETDKMQAFSIAAGFEHIHNCSNMASILPLCKMAICAPGAIVYELAYYGIPSVFLTVANNQLLSAKAHQKIGWCKVENGLTSQSIELSLLHLSTLWFDTNRRQSMSQIAQRLIDGKGVERICTAIKRELL